ncbi:hypothetical protein EOJ36_09585 [Sandaracinomonas limnophila]|uniref:Rieske domain-containing protein n=2 Tax=Sandaracinomonas limnophila TaxID=1862386 RepID=A0A437PPD0_9BACT|nr:hypothetical protein EOJ36_09585 [Sandaracinomonas limnophila]
MMDRKQFIKKICPASAIGLILTSEFLSACSKPAEEVVPTSDPVYDNLITKTKDNGFFVEGKIVYINLQNAFYATLKNVGNFVNDETNGILLLRKSETQIICLDNCCPHQGTRNRWSYANNKFTCANHGNSYGMETGQIAPCNSNTPFGNLKAYASAITKDIVTIQL